MGCYISASKNVQDVHSEWISPLAQPSTRWHEFYKRIKLFPWWLKYNVGIAGEAKLRKEIIEQGCAMDLQGKWMQHIIRHAVAEFSKKGLGPDYYRYHNIKHELEATFVSLLSAYGYMKKNSPNGRLTKKDIMYLFSAALLHDYDPLKHFDKAHEDDVEWFISDDAKIKKFIDVIGIDLDLVIAIIHRTAYPFKGEIAKHANLRMRELYKKAGIPSNDLQTMKHYQDLGWFLSVSERIAGYALGDFERAIELARLNAHALGWHPSLINEESVKYFSMLKEEKEMFENEINNIPEKRSCIPGTLG